MQSPKNLFELTRLMDASGVNHSSTKLAFHFFFFSSFFYFVLKITFFCRFSFPFRDHYLSLLMVVFFLSIERKLSDLALLVDSVVVVVVVASHQKGMVGIQL